MIENLLKLQLIVITIILVTAVASNEIDYVETDDAVIIEAKTPTSRKDKQLLHYFSPPWALALSEGNPCLTSQGMLGFCTSFHHCYPYIKSPDINLLQTWLLGDYESCTYFNKYAGQQVGVCCVNASLVQQPENQNNIGNTVVDVPDKELQSKDTIFQHWPPSVPIQQLIIADETTKRPGETIMQWPPPIPTHPPDHSYPTHPTFRPPLEDVSTTTTTKRPSWPPPLPTHPPHRPIGSYPGITTSTMAPTHRPAGGGSFQAHCGTRQSINFENLDSERIVGGQNAVPHEWPWVVALFASGRQHCGGSLIDDIHVLTAAHCVVHMTSWDVARLTANLGDHNIRSNSEVSHVERRIKRVVRHKGFEFRTLYHDIAILTLDKPVKFSKTITPICLPSGSTKAFAGKNAVVAGWGSIRENGPQPSILQKVKVPVWSNHECARKYGSAAPAGIIDSMVCAGQAARDSCSGDSGGPLMINEGARWVQLGIVSWGIGCGKGEYPGVYTRVSSYLPWIMKNIKTK